MGKITTEEFVQLTDHRPWGSFTLLADEVDHKVKRIVVKPGQRLSLQRHKYRREHWFVISGQAVATLNKKKIELKTGRSMEIGQGDIHRIQNESDCDMVFIEIQLGEYFGEDDIERLEDDYGRTGTI